MQSRSNYRDIKNKRGRDGVRDKRLVSGNKARWRVRINWHRNSMSLFKNQVEVTREQYILNPVIGICEPLITRRYGDEGFPLANLTAFRGCARAAGVQLHLSILSSSIVDSNVDCRICHE